MGSCSFSVRKSRLFISLTESSAFFLNYKENLICRFAVDSISTVIRLGPSAKIPKHCAYTFHSPFLYILGGCDDENILKNEVFKVNIEEFSLEYLSTLPINSKHGDLYIQNDFLYLIGAVHLQNYSAMPTPFMRLSTGSNWEVLGENTKTSRNFSVSNHLLRPGSCRHGSSLYLIGGEIIKGKAEKVFNTNVYCLDLNTLVINLLDFEGPSLCSPKCIYLTSGLLVFGGFGENGFNREMFILGSKKLKINENSLKVSGNKVIHKINNHFYLFGTKRLKKLSEEKLTWKVEELGFEEHVMRLDIKTCLNQKKQPESTRRVSIFPMFSDEDKSNLGSLRQDSRKHSPSNFFNSQADFDYSQTIQKLSLKELSDINSIMEMSEFK